MAKEMMIIFVYDTELLKNEEDDPSTAILYFHPGWVSDQQKTSLCGQIIGTARFLTETFTSPRIFALQSGKFAIRTYGRYILAVGTDRNIADWVLDHRADTLTSLINFFHHDLYKLSELYKDAGLLSGKLYHMFETYLKILMYGGHMFFNIPTVQLPKSASHVFLEAMQLLQSCQQLNCVLGGTILYHNKVVATQLSSDLTKVLVLTDPYRIKSPAESFMVNFPLPLGVQLLQVYINYKDYRSLYEDTLKWKNIPQYLCKLSVKKTSNKSTSTREPILSAMKRDQSLIFTTVPEEDTDQQSPQNLQAQVLETKSPDRPNSLNLKSKTTDLQYDIRTDSKAIPSTPYLGQTSICSTPMTDLNKVLHQNILSICVDPEEASKSAKENLTNAFKNFTKIKKSHSVSTSISKISETTSKSIPNNFQKLVPINFDEKLYDKKRSASMWEFRERLKKFNNRITMRYYSLGLSHITTDLQLSLEDVPKEIKYKTISDPFYPIFSSTGLAMSSFLYNEYIQRSMNLLDFNHFIGKKNNVKCKSLEKLNEPSTLQFKTENKPTTPAVSKESRKALSLPLKSLTSEQSENVFSPTNRNRLHGGVQLTPLMSKLSLLAMEERSSGFCSKDTTPSDYKDVRFTPSQTNYSFFNVKRKSSVSEDVLLETDDNRKTDNFQDTVLFICGQQDMVMGLLLEENIKDYPDVVTSLFDKCTESLGKLEKQLRHCLEIYSGGNGQNESGEPYSYLCMDPQWDNVRRGGPWGAMELGILTHFHRDFTNMSNLTEIILRNDESIVYGHHCGKTEVFYQQVAPSTAGLPTPADAMGTVNLKAKRRLERDHAIILL